MDKTVTEWQIMFTMTSGLEDFYTEDEDEYNEKFQDLIDDGDLQYVEQCIRKDYVWNEELEDWDEDYVEVLYDAENYDDYKDTQRGSVTNEYKYKVSSYYDMKYLGLEDTFYTNEWSEVEDEAHKKLMQGNCVLIQNLITGKEIKLNPDEYDETFDGEFLVKPDQLEESKQDSKLVKTFKETDYGWGNNETTYYGELNDGNYYVCLGEIDWTSMTIYDEPITKKYLDYLYREDDEDTELEKYFNQFEKEHNVTSKYSLESKEQIEQELNVDYLGYEDLDESKDTTNGEVKKLAKYIVSHYKDITGLEPNEFNKIAQDFRDGKLNMTHKDLGGIATKELDDIKEFVKKYDTEHNTKLYTDDCMNIFKEIDNEISRLNKKDEKYNVYTLSGEDGVYNSNKVDTVDTVEQAEDRVRELQAETGNNAYYEEADEWWEQNYKRAINYVANETPEVVVGLFGYGNKEDNAAWDMYMSSTSKSIALELLHYLGQEEFEKVLDEYERNLNESYVSYEEPYNGKKMSKAQWKEIYDKEINHDPNNDGWETFEDWWYDMTERSKLIVKESVEDDKLNANSALHSLGIDKSSKLIQELDTALEDNDEATIKKIINKFKQDLSANDFNSFIKTYYPEYKKIINKLSENSKTEALEKKSNIQGLEDYFEDDIKQIVKDYIYQTLFDADILFDEDDIVIKDIQIYGSRGRGTAREDSDLDVVFEYEGDFREDDLFNVLNWEGEELYIDGVRVDINPICAERSGDMNSFMARAKEYDKEILDKKKTESKYADDYRGNEYWEINDLYNEEGSITEEDVLEELKKIYANKQAIKKAYEEITGQKLDNLDESKSANRQLKANYKKSVERELEKVQNNITNAGLEDKAELESRKDFLVSKINQLDESKQNWKSQVKEIFKDMYEVGKPIDPDDVDRFVTELIDEEHIGSNDIREEMQDYCLELLDNFNDLDMVEESKDNKVEVENYHLEDMGGHTMAVFGSLKDGRYFAGNEEVMTIYDEDIWPQYCEDDPDTTVWEKEHTLISTSRYDTDKEKLQLYYDIISQTSFFDDEDLKWFKEHLGLDNNDVADKKEESRLVEKTNMELQEEIEINIDDAIYDYLIKDGYETEESAKEFIKDYVVVKTWYEDMTSASSAEILEKYLAVEVRAELDYDDLSTLSTYLDKVVQKYDASSYFDFITGGTIRAYIQVDTRKPKKTEDIVRTDIPNGKVNVSLSSARETLAELEDLENTVDNIQYADAISEKFADDLAEFEDGPIASEKEKLNKAIADTETRELNNMKKPKRGRKKTEAKEVNKANALLDLINEVYDGMGDMAELAEWAEILADDYNIDIDDESMETDEIMLTAFNKMNDNDFRNEVDNFIESLFENDGIEYLKDTLHTYPRNLKHIVQCLNTIKPYASKPDKIDTAIEELKSVNMNLRTTAEEFQEYLHNNFKPWTVLGTTTGPRTYVNLFEVPTDYDIVGADYFNYADRPSDMLDHIGYGWKQDGNNIVADLIGFKDSVKVGDNYAVAVYDQAPVKYGYSATIDSSNKEAKFKEMANALMSKAKEIKEKYNLKESKDIKTEAFWDDGKLYNYKGIDIQQSISDRGEKLYSILNNQKPFSIPDFSTLSAAKKYIDDNNLKSYKEKQESKKTEAKDLYGEWIDLLDKIPANRLEDYKIEYDLYDEQLNGDEKPTEMILPKLIAGAKKYIRNKKVEAVNIEDVNIEKEKEKVADDIQTAGVKDMIDTEKELEDGIKKEVYQFAKQQGLDLEKLRKQGVELETIADTIDTVIGDMVSKSAIEYMDQTNQEINWDFEIVGNDIKIVWEKK